MSDLVGNPEDRFSHIAAHMPTTSTVNIPIHFDQLVTSRKRSYVSMTAVHFSICLFDLLLYVPVNSYSHVQM